MVSEPTSRPVTVPRPREPTTTSRALFDSSMSSPVAPRQRTSVVISTSGCSPASSLRKSFRIAAVPRRMDVLLCSALPSVTSASGGSVSRCSPSRSAIQRPPSYSMVQPSVNAAASARRNSGSSVASYSARPSTCAIVITPDGAAERAATGSWYCSVPPAVSTSIRSIAKAPSAHGSWSACATRAAVGAPPLAPNQRRAWTYVSSASPGIRRATSAALTWGCEVPGSMPPSPDGS